jgi:hypothetical protein
MMCQKDLEMDGELVMDGGFAVISFHYGSRHDQMIGFERSGGPRNYQDPQEKIEKLLECEEVRAYICDDCFESNLDLFEGYRISSTRKEERIV